MCLPSQLCSRQNVSHLAPGPTRDVVLPHIPLNSPLTFIFALYSIVKYTTHPSLIISTSRHDHLPPPYSIPLLPALHLSWPLSPTLYSSPRCTRLPNICPVSELYSRRKVSRPFVGMPTGDVFSLLFPSPNPNSPLSLTLLTVFIPLDSFP